MITYFIDGFCVKHKKHFLSCSECWDKHQKQQSERWFEQQRLNAEAVRRFHAVTEQNYTAMCGNPIQTESFR